VQRFTRKKNLPLEKERNFGSYLNSLGRGKQAVVARSGSASWKTSSRWNWRGGERVAEMGIGGRKQPSLRRKSKKDQRIAAKREEALRRTNDLRGGGKEGNA